MDQIKIGKFIATLRRQSGLTQEKLGEKIGVTNKTISPWENGNYMPDIEMLQLLAKEFNVSINELLAGQKMSDEEFRKNADELKKMPELDFSSPLSTAAFAMLVLLEYDESPENTIEMLNVLKGPQPMNGMDVQFLRDRIKGRGYIPRSYFEGSSVKNDYTPNVPYKITVSEYAYTYQSEGYAKVQVQSSGADSPRPIELRRKGNQWFLWRNLALSDIRTPASVDPWA